MAVEFADRYKQDDPRSGFRDLDNVVLLVAMVSDTIRTGTRGTIVSVHGHGESYAVEFDEPDGALAAVRPHQIEQAEVSAL